MNWTTARANVLSGLYGWRGAWGYGWIVNCPTGIVDQGGNGYSPTASDESATDWHTASKPENPPDKP